MTNTEIQAALNANGFPCGPADGVIGPRTRAAVFLFQQAANSEPWLALDGIPGPKTQAALGALPNLSAHFTVAELRSKGNGDCYVRRELLVNLENLRARLGVPIGIISAYRDPVHNAAEGGAKNSMHLLGLAADTDPVATWQKVAGFRLFSGIGDRAGMVAHVDDRHLSPHNETPNATVANPARWTY